MDERGEMDRGQKGAGDRERRQAGRVRTWCGWGKRGERRTEGESVKRADRGGAAERRGRQVGVRTGCGWGKRKERETVRESMKEGERQMDKNEKQKNKRKKRDKREPKRNKEMRWRERERERERDGERERAGRRLADLLAHSLPLQYAGLHADLHLPPQGSQLMDTKNTHNINTHNINTHINSQQTSNVYTTTTLECVQRAFLFRILQC